MVTPYEGYVAVARQLRDLPQVQPPSAQVLFNSGAEAVERRQDRTLLHPAEARGWWRSTTPTRSHQLTMALTAKSMPYKAASVRSLPITERRYLTPIGTASR